LDSGKWTWSRFYLSFWFVCSQYCVVSVGDVSGVDVPKNFCFWLLMYYYPLFLSLSGSNCRECVLDIWNLNVAVLCSMGWLEMKLIIVSMVVGFLYISISSFVCLRDIVKSRKSMELWVSYVGLSFMLLFILFMYKYDLMACGLVFVASYMTRMSSTYRV
jgi:hypothetical protein